LGVIKELIGDLACV